MLVLAVGLLSVVYFFVFVLEWTLCADLFSYCSLCYLDLYGSVRHGYDQLFSKISIVFGGSLKDHILYQVLISIKCGYLKKIKELEQHILLLLWSCTSSWCNLIQLGWSLSYPLLHLHDNELYADMPVCSRYIPSSSIRHSNGSYKA